MGCGGGGGADGESVEMNRMGEVTLPSRECRKNCVGCKAGTCWGLSEQEAGG